MKSTTAAFWLNRMNADQISGACLAISLLRKMVASTSANASCARLWSNPFAGATRSSLNTVCPLSPTGSASTSGAKSETACTILITSDRALPFEFVRYSGCSVR